MHLTPEQHLKRIFLNLQGALMLPEPDRTECLSAMISVALSGFSHIDMPPDYVSPLQQIADLRKPN